MIKITCKSKTISLYPEKFREYLKKIWKSKISIFTVKGEV